MYIFRHKTKKWYFTITVPALFLIQIVAVMLVLSGCSSGNVESEMTDEQERSVVITYDMHMKIGDTPVDVNWEKNDAVDALAALTAGDIP